MKRLNLTVDPVKRIPNARELKIKLGPLDPVLEKHGFKRRKWTTLDIEPWKNRRMNRYLTLCVHRLNSSITNPRKFLRIVEHLLMRSTCFGMSAMYHILPL
jgi:hypothetical protein